MTDIRLAEASGRQCYNKSEEHSYPFAQSLSRPYVTIRLADVCVHQILARCECGKAVPIAQSSCISSQGRGDLTDNSKGPAAGS